MKKLISVTLILMLVLALGCTAFADSGVPITKNPTDEVRSAGGTAWFVSGAYNYNSAEWKFMDPNGTFMNAQEFRNRFPYATVTGENSTNLTVRNLGTDMNGYGVICTFYNNNGPTDTTMAFLYVSAAPVYTAPTYTAPVNTTPGYYIPYGATDGGYTYDETGHLEYDVTMMTDPTPPSIMTDQASRTTWTEAMCIIQTTAVSITSPTVATATPIMLTAPTWSITLTAAGSPMMQAPIPTTAGQTASGNNEIIGKRALLIRRALFVLILMKTLFYLLDG